MAITHEIWWEGTIEVIILPDGVYEARIRLAGETSIRIGSGLTPREAIEHALD